MYKVFYGFAIAAVAYGLYDSAHLPGTSQMLPGIFIALSPFFWLFGFIAERMTQKKCPACAENIKKAAISCKHCCADLD